MRRILVVLSALLALGQAVPAPVWRIAWVAPAAVLFTPRTADAAITSRVTWTASSGTTCTMAASLTSGTVLMIGYMQYSAGGSQTVNTVTTNGSSAGWAQFTNASIVSTGNRIVRVWRDLLNTESGSVNVILTASGAANFYCELIELPDTYDAEDDAACAEDPGAQINHPNADSDNIDTSANAFVYYATVLSANTSGTASQPTTVGGTWVDAGAEPVTAIGSGYVESASTLTDERAEWSHTGTPRTGAGCVVSFKNAPVSTARGLSLLGVGQ